MHLKSVIRYFLQRERESPSVSQPSGGRTSMALDEGMVTSDTIGKLD